MEPAITIPTFETLTIYALTSAILAGLAVMWLVRKSIKTSNRS